MKLDFSALSEPLTAIDTVSYVKWYQSNTSSPSMLNRELSLKALAAGFLLLFGLFGVSLGVTAIVQKLFSPPDTLLGVTYVLLPASISIALIIVFARRWIPKVDVEFARQYKFAQRNGLEYQQDIPDPSYAGVIFGQGRLRRLTESYIFPDGTQMGNYRYYDQSGRYEEIRTWSFVSMPLPRSLSHILLDSRKNEFFGGELPTLPNDLKGNILSLEGNFDKYFTVYVPVNFERDALYIMTPDVMAAMIDFGQAYDLEIVGDRLLLYRDGYTDLASAEELAGIMTIIGVIQKEIHQQASHHSSISSLNDAARSF